MTHATAIFTAVDVLDVVSQCHDCETMTPIEAETFLDENKKYIEEAMVRAGFDAINTLTIPLGTEGQDRESYSDDQDRESYTAE